MICASSSRAQWTTTGSDISNNNSGNVGIGTATPGYKLEVNGATRVDTLSINPSFGVLTYAGGVFSAFDILAHSGKALSFGSNDVYDRMLLDTNGNVGIGTTSPLAKFHVEGLSGYYTGYFHGLSTTSQSLGVLIDAGTNSSDYPLRVRSYNSADYFAIRGDGNIGIGTTSPNSVLDVVAAVPILTITGSTNNAFRGLAFRDGSTQVATIQSNANSGELRQTAGFATFGGFQTFHTNGLERVRIDSAGNVGIGTIPTSNSSYKLDVYGNTNITGNVTASGTINAKYQDVAEWVPSSEQLSAGTVVVLDSTKSNQVTASSVSYDTRVAGVVSEQPGIALGEKSDNKVLVATTGRVKVKVDASKGAIHVGDLLVTSDVPGVAMKSEPVKLGGVQLHRPGTLIGKALEPLEKGKGEILVL